MSKLRLKETSEEREQRKAKEQRRAARKQRKRGPDLHFDYENDLEDRMWKLSEPIIYRTPQDVEVSYDLGETGAGSSSRPGERRQTTAKPVNYEQIRKEMEEATFRAKLFDAMGDDERLDSIEARFNAYHVPDRWQDSEPSSGIQNPNHMDEDEYAEWIRRGIWERRHKQEIEEQQRREREREERKAQKKKKERETRKMEEVARQKRLEREGRTAKEAYDTYLSSWSLLAARALSHSSLRLGDIPWPMASPLITIADITSEAVVSFLFSEVSSTDRQRKQRIREALLIYHPDRFEKWATLIADKGERELAKEAAGTVVRILNALAEQ